MEWNQTIDDGGDADCLSLSLVDEAAVCEKLSHYMEKEEDFLKSVGSLLVAASASASPIRERLTVAAFKFLTIVSMSDHHELFDGNDDKLEQIIQGIVIPNVMLSDEDEELFKRNHAEFIRRGVAGSCVYTRRRIACELLKGVAGNYKEKITESVATQIYNYLAMYAENPDANWKYKECAIYLVSETNLVDVESFFTSFIVPELHVGDENTFPMLKAAALKFFTSFHVLIPKHLAMDLVGDVVRFLGSHVKVVRSYAARCIEKLLLVKDKINGVQVRRYTSVKIDPIHSELMGLLFWALQVTPFLEENDEYIMRCMMRVLQIADISPKIAEVCIGHLTEVIYLVRKKPKNPVFNYFVYEAVAAYVRRACEKNPSLVPTFRTCLVPSLLHSLQSQNTELHPYVFLLLAQVVDLITPPVDRSCMYIFDSFLGPDLCEKSSVPAVVRLLQSFLQKAPNEVNTERRLRNVFALFNKLVSSPTTEEQGFHILNTVIDTYGYGVIAEYMNHVWDLLFTRLQNSKTPTFVRCLIIFMSLFLVKHGIQTLVDLINSVQADLFHKILGEFWIPNLKTISTGYNYMEVKLCAVASTKLLYGSPLLLDPAAEELWGKLLDAIVTLLSQPLPLPDQDERVEDDDFYIDFDFDFGGYQEDTFVPLHNTGKKKQEDPLKDILDPRQFLVAFPANLSSQFHGKFPLVIMRYLSPANQATLVRLCDSYNIAIV